MKAILEFNLPEDKSDHVRAIKATDCYCALFEMTNELFRPARKHGYSDPELIKLNEYINYDNGMALDIIAKLENKFFRILEDHGINLDDLE